MLFLSTSLLYQQKRWNLVPIMQAANPCGDHHHLCTFFLSCKEKETSRWRSVSLL